MSFLYLFCFSPLEFWLNSLHWATFKCERLPIFCHYCGLLGHDLQYCAAHFEFKKSGEDFEYQYADWLRATSNRQRSPTRQKEPRTRTCDTDEIPIVHGTRIRKTTDDTSNKMVEKVSGVSSASPCQGLRTESDSRGYIPENPKVHMTNMEVQVDQEDLRPNLGNQVLLDTIQSGHTGLVLAISQVEPRHTKEVNKDVGSRGRWTRMTRVDVGLTYPLFVELGKKGSTWREEEHSDCNIDDHSSKREKQTLLSDDLELEYGSARVVKHPCQDQ